ncbi:MULTISPECIES: hypothetical protein [Rhizobium/Agrobacterium group]|uniref:hypothetical protein n=1 Tax=Rhizobium/Agrobacterium group TaxID=227290 RepID=UPI000925D7D2|nr:MULTISPECIES: hypothetical protein [Rhizobium/Agrobacterium group]OJH54712.1 hypothetical protein ATN81_11820 [Agrobacterium pusense]OJH59213.1 hypothetical protein BA725_13420 [Agrobacterium pusense]CAD7052950.1 hypothetical protein RP007_01491 [Rhizobium sp. P007]
MNKRNELRTARTIVASSCTALGPLPAARVLRDHYATIAGWRNQGASWDQIATILSDAGWRSKSGGIVSAPVVRAMVSRIQRSQPAQPRPSAPLETVAPAASDMPRPAIKSAMKTVNPTSTDVADRIRRAAALRSGKDER